MIPSFTIYCINLDEGPAETAYEEINESSMNVDGSMDESFWSDASEETGSDVINYYIQPVNEYENTVLVLYENYMESQGYQDPVCVKDKCKGEDKGKKSTASNEDDDGYDNKSDDDDDDDDDDDEIPLTTLTYDILSNSPVELFLYLANLDP